jgi:hypothetical protein
VSDERGPRAAAWEYKLVPMGNPLEPGVEERANAFGADGWELAGIDAAVWVFKRPRRDAGAEGPLRALLEQTVPLPAPAGDPAPPTEPG